MSIVPTHFQFLSLVFVVEICTFILIRIVFLNYYDTSKGKKCYGLDKHFGSVWIPEFFGLLLFFPFFLVGAGGRS